MKKNTSKTSAVTPSEDTPMFELEYIQRRNADAEGACPSSDPVL